jgi:predicted membrane protein
MDANECKQERFSSRTIGIVFLVVSILLFVIGLVVLPVVGFIFAIPLVLIGVVMLMAPESKACQMIRKGLKVG